MHLNKIFPMWQQKVIKWSLKKWICEVYKKYENV